MSRRRMIPGLIVLAAAAGVVLYCLFRPGATVPAEFVDAGRAARIKPDYSNCTIPPNIAPLNFVIEETGRRYCVRISSERGESFVVAGRSPGITIPLEKWRRLLAANRGETLRFEIYAMDASGGWRRFRAITNTISAEEIDGYVAYRLLKPLHNLYASMGTYQRDLGSYDESPILLSRFPATRCVNCHTFVNNRADTMILHMRGADALAMLLAKDGKVTRIDTRTKFSPSPAAYSSWHPSGRLIAFSMNKLLLFHHKTGNCRDVFDYASDLGVYLVKSNRVTGTRKIADPDLLETFPAWSPDGRYLYFSRAKKAWDALASFKMRITPPNYRQVRYDLMRIGYDVADDRWGDPEIILSAKRTGKSILQPRPSPDGRFLLFCMTDYGNFPVYQRSSDLYMMDLRTGRHWPLKTINSDRSESWHCWSSNARWIVFASKRADGLFGRLYFSYIDRDGQAHKPFLLPQKDPTFYDSFLENFNVPELITGPVTVKQREFLRAIFSSQETTRADVISGATPKTVPPSPASGPAPALDPYERP